MQTINKNNLLISIKMSSAMMDEYQELSLFKSLGFFFLFLWFLQQLKIRSLNRQIGMTIDS